ncbi:ABC transporter ATP-binding protein [Peptoniphilus olsenii]|uniref:ABC transporter ATP-binding protein n=1 Tax=Peptoniphilus olsenii TaxID=411570 RepID=UPI00339B0FD7
MFKKDYSPNKKDEDKETSFLVNDVNEIYRAYYENLIYFVNSIVMLIISTFILISISVRMAIVIMGSLILVFMIPRYVGKNLKFYNKDLSIKRGKYLSTSDQLFCAAELINYRDNKNIENIYFKSLENMQESNYNLDKYQSLIQIVSGSSLYIQMLLAFIFGLIFSYKGIITIGEFAAAQLYCEYIAQYSMNLVDELLEIRGARVYFDKLEEIQLNLFNSKVRKKFRVNSNIIEIKHLIYSIDKKPLFNGLNLKVKKNLKYILKGKNGSGKSTLFKIIIGLINRYEGSVELSTDKIKYIPQEKYLFNGTVLENITLFDDNIKPSDIYSINNLKEIFDFKYDLDHYISYENNNLSGGESRKICLIRTLYKEADLYLLDEPMNDLDLNIRVKLLKYLEELNSTIIVIDHNINQSNSDFISVNLDNNSF